MVRPKKMVDQMERQFSAPDSSCLPGEQLDNVACLPCKFIRAGCAACRHPLISTTGTASLLQMRGD